MKGPPDAVVRRVAADVRTAAAAGDRVGILAPEGGPLALAPEIAARASAGRIETVPYGSRSDLERSPRELYASIRTLDATVSREDFRDRRVGGEGPRAPPSTTGLSGRRMARVSNRLYKTRTKPDLRQRILRGARWCYHVAANYGASRRQDQGRRRRRIHKLGEMVSMSEQSMSGNTWRPAGSFSGAISSRV
jgi:hypothetical protein